MKGVGFRDDPQSPTALWVDRNRDYEAWRPAQYNFGRKPSAYIKSQYESSALSGLTRHINSQRLSFLGKGRSERAARTELLPLDWSPQTMS